MAGRSSAAPLAFVGGAVLLGVGAALALRPSAGSAPSAPPAAGSAPPGPDPGGNTGVVPPHLRDRTRSPATDKPVSPTVEQAAAAVEAFNKANREWKAYLSDLAAGMGVQADELEKAKIGLGALGTVMTAAASVAAKVAAGAAAAGASANVVPLVGQIVAAAAAVVAFIAQWVNTFKRPQGLLASEIRRQVNLRVRPPEVTGWRNGTYFSFDVPVFGPKIDEYEQLIHPSIKVGVWGDQWTALYQLAKAYPWGPPVPWVEVLGDGTYQYEYNRYGTNDRSPEAQRRGDLRVAQTRDPREVTPYGRTGRPAEGQPQAPPPDSAPPLQLSAGPMPSEVTRDDALRAGYVVLYEDEAAGGRAYVLPVGEYAFLEDVGIPNDAITAVYVPEGRMVAAYEDRDFGGRGRALFGGTDYLGDDWNDILSSAKVLSTKPGERTVPALSAGPLPADVSPEEALQAGAALVYEHEQYEGRAFVLPLGEYPWVEDVGIPNDTLTSVRVPPGVVLEVYADRNFEGSSTDLLGSRPYIYDFNDRVSSAKVLRAPVEGKQP